MLQIRYSSIVDQLGIYGVTDSVSRLLG